MPFDGMVRRYLDNLYFNLLANKQALTEWVNRLCARCCTQHLTHTCSGKCHVEPTIGWLRVLRSLNSEVSVIIAALTVASQMAGFGRPMCLSLSLIRAVAGRNCTTNSYVQFPFSPSLTTPVSRALFVSHAADICSPVKTSNIGINIL